jgi:Ca-activated chloride channel family protein
MNRLHRVFAAVLAATAASGSADAQGVLIPTDARYQPCTITFQRVTSVIRDQAAETRIEQEFHNPTSTALEAFYMFPIPEKAAIKDFAMTVDGKRVKGEVVEAPKARKVYEDIVRRTRDPGLLESMGKNLWRVRVFPVPANGKQKFELTYTEVVTKDAGIASYTYPLKAGGSQARINGNFVVRLDLHSTPSLKSVYSPTHAVGVTREGDHKAIVGFEESNTVLNRDFQVFWTTDDRDVGLSLLGHRDSGNDQGYFLMLVSPKVEADPGNKVPRDVVFVLDTSGSMREDKMAQARKALEFCIKALDSEDRFGVLAFATTVNPYSRDLKKADKPTVESAVEWVRKLEAGGGTAIGDALIDALKMKSGDARNFTVVFLTDGQPTIGETDPNAILKSAESGLKEGVRIFTFGVGDDVNTHLLDQLADQSRAVSTYVRPKEDLEVKVSSFFDKIRRPVLTNLSIDVDGDKRFADVYPPKLPDLFHGGQLVVMGRYSGSGDGNVRLKGKVGDKEKEFIYKVNFPESRREADFLPSLWARRKIGYLLDQIRLKGETAELRDEVIHLAKRHGIATPYTSYLVVPDNQMGRGPVAAIPFGGMSRGEGETRMRALREGDFGGGGGLGGGLGDRSGTAASGGGGRNWHDSGVPTPGAAATGQSVAGMPARAEPAPKESGAARKSVSGVDPSTTANFGVPLDQSGFVDEAMKRVAEQAEAKGEKKDSLAGGGRLLGTTYGRQVDGKYQQWNVAPEAGRDAVNLAIALNKLKDAQNPDAVQNVRTKGKSSFLAVGPVWVDKEFRGNLKVVKVKYLSEAYFEVVEKVPGAKEVLSLGSQLVWKTQSGVALVIDNTGTEKLSDEEWNLLLELQKPVEKSAVKSKDPAAKQPESSPKK